MKALSNFLLRVITLLLFRQAAAEKCSPFEYAPEDQAYTTCASSISPFFGPEVGGTVVKIGNGDVEGCPLRSDINILCQFENEDGTFQEVEGIVVRLNTISVECVSPFSGQPKDVKVSYSMAPVKGCESEVATKFEVDEKFQYIGNRAGLLVNNARPTPGPSVSPSSTTTQDPSLSPFDSPSSSPSPAPTPGPTNSPSSTRGPTKAPSLSPLYSQAPTSLPTGTPFNTPSLSPTAVPSITPSVLPKSPSFSSKSPSTSSKSPSTSSKSPTRKLTNAPTKRPTKKPIPNPTSTPTLSPTSGPTNKPSMHPTPVPTDKPTSSPTRKLTNAPTKRPTRKPIPPTKRPTRKPTKTPIASPSDSPTDSPSASPTVSSSPTVSPSTSTPTSPPSSSPTTTPTITPSSSPTTTPTITPSSSPSNSPSLTPSFPFFLGPSDNRTTTGQVVSSLFRQVEEEPKQLFFVGNTIEVEWNSAALEISAFRESEEQSNMSLNVEILAYIDGDAPNLPPFLKIQSFNGLPVGSNKATFVLDDDIISPYMMDWGSNENRVAIILVRVVVSSLQFSREDDKDAQRILATRTSKLIGVLPESMEGNVGECPILPNEECEHDLIPCPPSHSLALEDIIFSPDETCLWPSGNNTCDPRLDLDVDYLATCFYTQNSTDFCDDIDLSDFDEDEIDKTDGCPCASSHPMATGCVNNGLTQCCYTENGALITQYDDGAGRPTCIRAFTPMQFKSIGSFLYDTLPYLLCCGVNELDDSCESILNAFPDSIIDNDYDNPTTAAVSFGDPHLISFDRVNYNFNGFGEYVAACGGPQKFSEEVVRELCSTSRRRLQVNDEHTAIHYRFRPLVGNTQGATVHVGIAIQDPTFNSGTKTLIIILNGKDRLHFYDGSELIRFSGTRGRLRVIRSGATIVIPRRTNRRSQKVFTATIVFASGLKIKIVESEGVMNPTITRPRGHNTFIGLMGQGDDDTSNDFKKLNGARVPIRINKNITENSYTGLDDSKIFDDFGKEWEIEQPKPGGVASLFGAIEDIQGQRFEDFYKPLYRPNFDPFFNSKQSDEPSSSPSSIPSSGPSTRPSSMPSSDPSALPSVIPSAVPSYKPSDEPNFSPSSIPSSGPSTRPSSMPSSGPSVLPSVIPSAIPSFKPSDEPSSSPSNIPSSVPSTRSSSMPSSGPSVLPSVMPSSKPSDEPSSSPSSIPSSVPSTRPSSMPSSGPSVLPSVIPSAIPSFEPSDEPSSSPSSIPSSVPSARPSSMPSSGPSVLPSVIPSTVPSSTKEPDEDNNARQLQGSGTDAFCAEYEDTFIRRACIFDFNITENEALVRSTSDFAQEEKVIQAVLTNTAPVVLGGGRIQTMNVGFSENATFQIVTSDTDGDIINAALTRNDNNLFEISSEAFVPGMYEVQFFGSDTVGTYRSHVTLTDGMAPVLVTITVKVGTPTVAPTGAPSSSPTDAPTSAPITCFQNPATMFDGQKKRDCAWLTYSKKRRKNKCKLLKSIRNCPSSCGLCCADDESFNFKVSNGLLQNCAWIAKKFNARKKQCNRKIVKGHCQLTCKNCQDPTK